MGFFEYETESEIIADLGQLKIQVFLVLVVTILSSVYLVCIDKKGKNAAVNMYNHSFVSLTFNFF